jgi:class III poly(R)-hydroxyalkanoic acid synthase PhaE subunit
MPGADAATASAGAKSEGVSDQYRDLGMRWLEAGQSYLQGWQQFAQRSASGAAAGETPQKFGDDMLNAWQGTWAGAASAGEGATRQFADLISRLPALGLAREQTEAWRELLAAQVEYQHLEQELRTTWAKVQTDALAMLEVAIRERRAKQTTGATPGIEDYRELYNLWVECGEKVFAQVAHSESYSKLQAQLGNAAIRLKLRQQAVLERALKQFDLPTRSELNTVHKQMRELRERVTTLEAQLAAARGEERS